MSTPAQAQELSSWKEISSHLGVSIKTAQLWEQQRGLPVHRLPGPRGRVYAQPEELAAWKKEGDREVSHPHKRRMIFVAILGLVGIVALGVRQPSGGEIRLDAVQPLTASPGLEIHPSLSPDATQFAFVRIVTDGNPELCIQEVSSGSVHIVDSVLAGTHARWSPDSSLLAYSKGSPEGAAILVRDKFNSRRIVTTLFGEDRKSEMLNALILDWMGPEELVISDRASPGQPLALVGVNTFTGKRRRLTEPKFGPGDVQPTVGANTLAFARYSSHSEGDVYLLDLRTGTERRVTTNHARIDGISWSADSRGLIIGSTIGGPEVSLYHVTLEGILSRLSGVGETASFPSVSKSRLLFQAQTRDTNIWEFTDTARPVASSTRMEFGPAYGPDGRTIAFMSKRSGSIEVWLKTESAILQLTKLGQHYTDAPRWSPDGRTIAFTSQKNGNRDIHLFDIATTAVRRFTTVDSEEGRASFSRDGKSVYYRSNWSGRDQIWKQPIHGEPVQLTKEGGFEPFESVDGTILYYVKARNRPELWQIPAQGGKETLAHPGVAESRWGVAVDGVYILRATSPATVVRWNSSTNKETLVYTLPTDRRLEAGFSISSDAKRMSWAQVDRHEADILQAVIQGN